MAPAQLRPFHETIIDAIERISGPVHRDEIFHLIDLILATHIPKGHDAIIKAIDKFFDSLPCSANYLQDIRTVKEHLRTQKAAIKQHTPVDLDDLQQETEKLLALLKDRNPRLMSWWESMQHHLQRMHGLISQALDK